MWRSRDPLQLEPGLQVRLSLAALHEEESGKEKQEEDDDAGRDDNHMVLDEVRDRLHNGSNTARRLPVWFLGWRDGSVVMASRVASIRWCKSQRA